jgi:glycosyltransferase involved in cell wall biosynthesis
VRILFLSDNFPPEVNAPASRTFEHCREWVGQGHEVTVITCFPNFPHGKVYDGYKNQLRGIERIEGINIVRVWSYISANSGFAKRILDYSSFMISSIFTSFRLGRHDIIVGTSPQFFTVVAALVISKLKSTPYVFELRDIWPESIRAVGAMKDSFILNFLERIELILYQKASQIISVTNSFKTNLVARGISSAKIMIVRNGVDVVRFFPQLKDQSIVRNLNLADTFNIGYIGTHGLAHALETIIDAAEIMSSMPSTYYQRIRFILIGSGANKSSLIDYAKKKDLSNIIFLESVPKERVVAYWSILDLAIVHLKKTPLFEAVIPSKIFECMAMGIPILHGVQGESAELIRDEQVGDIFEPENAQALVDSICRLYDDPLQRDKLRHNCLKAARKYDRAIAANRMLKFLESV